mmetsp:Transcript_20673/g.29179  ORF Transcript_20673/g.29179 Transcript_20673/m.29179 type:complete len:380 (+) Transcript_20673:108-1247(+)
MTTDSSSSLPLTTKTNTVTPARTSSVKNGDDSMSFQSPRSMAEAAVAQAMAVREQLKVSFQMEAAVAVPSSPMRSPSNKRLRFEESSNEKLSNNTRPASGDNNSNDIKNDTSACSAKKYEELLQEIWEPRRNKSSNDQGKVRGYDDGDHDEEDENGDTNTNEESYGNDFHPEEALRSTLLLVYEQIDGIVRSGLKAFHDLDSTLRLLDTSNEVAESSSREVERLRASEEQNRNAISNLFKAVETAKSDTRDMSRVAQVEARLRRDITSLRSERDEALSTSAELNRKAVLLEEELRLVRAKLGRVAQEKIKLERDSRAAISLAKSLDSHASSDTDFYKRKVRNTVSPRTLWFFRLCFPTTYNILITIVVVSLYIMRRSRN